MAKKWSQNGRTKVIYKGTFVSNQSLVQQHWELELVTESQLGEVQMKPPRRWLQILPESGLTLKTL